MATGGKAKLKVGIHLTILFPDPSQQKQNNVAEKEEKEALWNSELQSLLVQAYNGRHVWERYFHWHCSTQKAVSKNYFTDKQQQDTSPSLEGKCPAPSRAGRKSRVSWISLAKTKCNPHPGLSTPGSSCPIQCGRLWLGLIKGTQVAGLGWKGPEILSICVQFAAHTVFSSFPHQMIKTFCSRASSIPQDSQKQVLVSIACYPNMGFTPCLLSPALKEVINCQRRTSSMKLVN